MTTTQIDRSSTRQDSQQIRVRPATRVAAATVPSRDTEDAQRAAAVAALVTAVSLLVVGLFITMTTSLTAPPLRGFAITAALASAPFAAAALVYARHRLIRIATNRWR